MVSVINIPYLIYILTGGEYIVNQEKFVCPQPSNTKPIADTVLECRLDNGTNVYQVDSGDRYRNYIIQIIW